MTKIVTISFTEDDSAEQLMVSFPVGQNANNFHADIQLVQYMIGLIYIHKSEEGVGEWNATMTPAEIRALPEPSVDFKSLTKTAALIRRFQTDSRKQGIVTALDGRVDPASTTVSSISHTPYTILVANFFLKSALDAINGEDSNYIDVVLADPELPPLAKAGLLASRGAT